MVQIYGTEAWAGYQAYSFWWLPPGLTWMEDDLRLKAGSTDAVGVNNERVRWQF
jgi:hypothetical protein